MANSVAILGESGTLNLTVLDLGAPALEFRSAAFRGAVDERRVIVVFLTIPSLAQEFTLRFEFTDPGFATLDLFGVPTKFENTAEAPPRYGEPKDTRRLDEGR